MQDFLELYVFDAGVLHTRRDFYDLTAAYLRRAASEGVAHAELHFDAQGHTIRRGSWTDCIDPCWGRPACYSLLEALMGPTQWRPAAPAQRHAHARPRRPSPCHARPERRGVPLADALGGIQDAIRAQAAVSASVILAFDRRYPEASAAAALADAIPFIGPPPGISAVGLAGPEIGNPPSKFEHVYFGARRLGLHAVAHAGGSRSGRARGHAACLHGIPRARALCRRSPCVEPRLAWHGFAPPCAGRVHACMCGSPALYNMCTRLTHVCVAPALAAMHARAHA